MLKLEVFETGKPLENVVRLKMFKEYDNVVVAAVDASGNVVSGGYILYFDKNGNIHRYRGTTNSIGLKLNAEGQIAEV